MEKLKLPIFNNITPATFQDSKTYVEQLRLLRDKLNEVIDVVNQMNSQEGREKWLIKII